MSRSNDKRLLRQSERALSNLSEWLRDLDTVQIDGEHLDAIGELLHAVDQAQAEVDRV
jgi:thioesterase domain-containing protein